MTPSDLRAKQRRLEREAEGKDRQRFMPTMVRAMFKSSGLVLWAEIRSNAGILWKWGAKHRVSIPRGLKSVYQPFQRSSVNDKRGVEGWVFGRESL